MGPIRSLSRVIICRSFLKHPPSSQFRGNCPVYPAYFAPLKFSYNAGVAELADAGDLKSPGLWPCGFESRPRHLRNRGGDFLAIVMGLVVGSVFDWAASSFLPSHPARDFFVKKVEFGIPQFSMDLVLFSFSAGILFRFSLIMVITAVIFYVVYRNI